MLADSVVSTNSLTFVSCRDDSECILHIGIQMTRVCVYVYVREEQEPSSRREYNSQLISVTVA